jgi:RNA polymerase sigma factor (sigma-70 family)
LVTAAIDVSGPSDDALIRAVRKGARDAYGELYERHVVSARNLARQLARSPAEADDLVSEAFAKVLETLRAGRGPDSAFRAYLLTTLRHTAYDKARRDKKVELSDDVGGVSGVRPETINVPFTDTAVAGLERTLAVKAFARLPERWQMVLWHTEIEGQPPAEVAPLLGLTSNGVTSLAYRAREGLRQAYLQVHLAESEPPCLATAERLGSWTRGGLSKRETAQVESHLDECERCRMLADELADVNSGLRLFVAPLVLGSAVVGYLSAAKATAVGAVALGMAGATSAGGAGIAGATGVGPRHLFGVSAFVATLAAAVAIALTAGEHPSAPTNVPTTVPTVTIPATTGPT